MKNPFKRIDQPEDETGAQINVLLDYIAHLEDENRKLKKRGDAATAIDAADDFHVIVDQADRKMRKIYDDSWEGSS